MFKIFEMVDNTIHEIFHASTWNEAQDYLWKRWSLYRAENLNNNDDDDEAEQLLFYSHFNIEKC